MNKRAFTLIELLAVVVIIAIIATIGIYSVTKIINKSRLNSLKDTALGIRKAAGLYVASHPDVVFPKDLDLTPGNDSFSIPRGAEASLMDLGKDPWGKDYVKIIAKMSKVNNKVLIEVYLYLENGDYFLNDNAIDLSPLIFQAINLTTVSSVGVGENIVINYEVLDEYKDLISEVIPVIKKNGVEVSASAYQIINSTNSSITLKLNSSGNYSCQLILKRSVGKDSAISEKVDFSVLSAPIFLPATMYFRSDTTTVNGLNAYKLDSTNSNIWNSFGYYDDDRAYFYDSLHAFIKIIRRASGGAETVISNHRQAAVFITSGYAMPYLRTANYNFPGWTGGNETDSLVVEVGLSHLATGDPIFTRRFTTDALNATGLKPQTWTIYYYLDNDWEESPWATFLHGNNTTAPSRIVTTQT